MFASDAAGNPPFAQPAAVNPRSILARGAITIAPKLLRAAPPQIFR